MRHPVLLARHAQIQVEHEIRVARTALQTARADLPRLGLHEGAIEHAIKLYAAELMQLQHIARSVRAVTRALGERPLTRARERADSVQPAYGPVQPAYGPARPRAVPYRAGRSRAGPYGPPSQGPGPEAERRRRPTHTCRCAMLGA